MPSTLFIPQPTLPKPLPRFRLFTFGSLANHHHLPKSWPSQSTHFLNKFKNQTIKPHPTPKSHTIQNPEQLPLIIPIIQNLAHPSSHPNFSNFVKNSNCRQIAAPKSNFVLKTSSTQTPISHENQQLTPQTRRCLPRTSHLIPNPTT